MTALAPQRLAEIRAYIDDGEPIPSARITIRDLLAHIDALTAERDQARDIAARLEAENAAALALHYPCDGFCVRDGDRWPCDTAAELGVESDG